MLGPIFNREATVVPKRPKTYLMRGVYVLSLFLLLCTGYLVLDGSRSLMTSGDAARFGGWMFTLLAPLQLLVLAALAAVGAASSVAQEKDRRTLILLLLTRLSGFEVVVGKLTATLLAPMSMLLCALPLFLTLPLLGGVSPQQVIGVFVVTAATILLAGSIGTVIGMWREKTFQAIALTVMALLMYVGLGEIAAELLSSLPAWLTLALSPPRALFAAASPLASLSGETAMGVALFVAVALSLSAIVLAIGVAKVRVWNPSREVRLQAPEPENSEEAQVEATPTSWKARAPRRVWDNPILWREVCTWAYGRKVVVIRVAFVLFFLLIAAVLYSQIQSGVAMEPGGRIGRALPSATLPLAALGVISLVLVNALAVNSVTGERDGLALDLLLVTDLSPKEFVFGKLLGVLYVGKEMILLPILLVVFLAFQRRHDDREHVLRHPRCADAVCLCDDAGYSLGVELCGRANRNIGEFGNGFFLVCRDRDLHDDHGQLSRCVPASTCTISGDDSRWRGGLVCVTRLAKSVDGHLLRFVRIAVGHVLRDHAILAADRSSLRVLCAWWLATCLPPLR